MKELFEKPAGAIIDGDYRYLLWRSWDSPLLGVPTKPLVWIMLNPSTADGEDDDPTLRRCVGFAKAWGYSRTIVVNLFAFRSPNPGDLISRCDPVGPRNDHYVQRAIRAAPTVVAAWGSPQITQLGRLTSARADEVWASGLRDHVNVVCLGMAGLSTGKRPEPRHPLYMRKDLTPQPYRRAP